MRLVALFVFLAGCKNMLAQEVKFQVQFSEPLAIFQFVSAITPNSGNNAYKSAFDSSRFNNAEHKSILEQFEALNYVYWYEYPQYPYGNKIGGSTYFLLGKNLIESKTIEEFESKSVGIIPNSDLAAMSKVLLSFAPVYRELILNPNREILNSQIRQFRTKIRETNISYYVGKIKHFHNSSWNTARPFILNICPTPPGTNINATAFFNYAYINLPSNQKDMDLVLTLMFHEAFHIVYDEQPLQFKTEFANWFRNNSSRYSKYAELLFNEAITTTLANGYMYYALKKSLMDADKWYNNPYIAAMAVEIYPMTLKYLEAGKQVDKSFVDEYIRMYETKFPQWITDIPNLMGDRYILCADQQVYRAISRKFRYRNIDEYAREMTTQNLQKIKSLPITKLIVLPDSSKAENIAMIKETFPELKDWKPDTSADFSHATFLSDKTYLIIVNATKRPAAELLAETKF